MTLRTAVLAAALLALALAPAAAMTPPAAAPAPSVAQFLASLQPAAPAPAVLSPIAGALPAAGGCGCFTQHTQCCQSCAHNNTCVGNAGCQSLCSDELQQCQCACQGTC